MNLNQVTVPSIDLEKSVTFYKTLGLQLIADSIPRYARFTFPKGDATFSIHRVEELPKGSGVIVYFECDDLDDQVKRLRQKGIGFELLPTDQDWLWREARLKDSDGNQLILYRAGENRKNPPWRINPDK